MSETRIEITVSGDNAEETLAQIAAQLPDTAQVVAEQDLAPTPGELFAAGLDASLDLPEKLRAWFESTPIAPMQVLLIYAVILIAAYGVERVLRPLFASLFLRETDNSETAAAGLIASLRRALVIAAGLVVFVIVAGIGNWLFLPAAEDAQRLASVVFGSVMLARVWYAVMELLTGSRDPARRPTGLTDSEAAHVMRHVTWFVIFLCALNLVRGLVVDVADTGASSALFSVICRFVMAAIGAVFFFAIRKPVGRLIVLAYATEPDAPGAVVRLMSRFWPAFYTLLLFLQVFADSRSDLMGAIGGEGASARRSFAALVLLPFLLAGLGIWRDTVLSKINAERAGLVKGLFSLLEGTLIVSTGVFILYAWNIDPFATDLQGVQRIVPGLVSAAIVVVIGWSLWRTAIALLAGVEPGGSQDNSGPRDDEGGVGGSRIETVLPVVRAVLAGFIGTVTVLLVLSSLGVEIAPLLAGAGILGLAIGFGAQKVVEDVISGVLYLVEDAFRKGEYIETAQGKGIVEAIMLRSVRLRHHLGPVFTIPFSAMGTIQNHSRDWVTVKLKFEVGPDQDLEKVRKLVKKVGEQLLDDPELEGQFLAPLKSQGAVALIGSNYQIGVKFTSEPGKQFLIRRKALNAIQKAFKENGIEMAAPRVVVDSPEQAEAAAAQVAAQAQAAAAKA